MTIETPAGAINQITPIREFVELTTITNAQYLLGIQNMSTGNGSKITFGNLITSLISGNADNKLVKGSDDKLFISTPIEIGTLANLTTSDKTDLVSAINELNSNMGSLSNLETTVKTSLVAAINSVAELTEPELLLDKINQSKALITGNVASYQEELEQIRLMKRSTFDLAKFNSAKNGSPTVTNNGIMKKTSVNTGNKYFTNLTNSDTFKIKSRCSFKPSEQIFVYQQGENIIFLQLGTNSYIRLNASGNADLQNISGVAYIYRKLNSTVENTINFPFSQSVGLGEPIDIEIIYDLTNIIFNIYSGNTLIATKTETASDFINSESQISAQNYYSWYSYNIITYYLPYTSVVVNGMETLNFNKTGIDTIIPYDPTDTDHVIGSITVTDNHIASGFSASNYLNYTVTDNTNTIIEFSATSGTILTNQRCYGNNQAFGQTTIGINDDGDWICSILGSPDTTTIKQAVANEKLFFKITPASIAGKANIYYRTSLANEWQQIAGSWNYPLQASFFGRGYSTGWLGIMDLNDLKVYDLEGNIVWTPALNIPYTESKTWSKIVNAVYRDRVNYMADQLGYANYYTLDDDNGNFTLPHGEIYGMLEQNRTENEQNNEAVRQIIDVKDNLYKILEGHQSTNKTLWDLITFTDNSEADNLLIGGDSPFTSNSSSSDFHFYLLDSTVGSSYNPDDTAKANVYKLFNKSHFDSQSDPIVVQDGTIVITCANPTKLSKILLRSYDTNTALPTIITVSGANITNNMSREITSSDFSNAKYIGGISQTKEAAYNNPTSTNWGLNRPLELTIDDKDTFNTFFINMTYWYVPSGTARRLVGIKLYGTQMANDDSDYTVKMSGEYENCKWIASNGNIYNTDDLYRQYGYIPKEKASLARWVSCFGSGIGQANAATRAAEQYYPKYISGSISSTALTSGQPWWILRQTNYSAENRPKTGYNTSSAGYIQKNTTLNNQTVIDYTADSYFPVGEYYWEGIFGYNDAVHNNCYLANWCQLQKVYDDDSIEIIQTFSKEGSMYESSVCYRTPRFYASRAFKKLRLIIQEENYPNNAFILSQMQLYYRDTAGTIARSFIPSATQYDLSYNTVKHKSNIHFFITPTGVRVGSNCFVQKTDPTVRAACVGNRWINENTKKSYVCNTSGVWTEEDFCEIGCMTMFGSKHVGMKLRTVANSENPIQKYIQDYEDIGGNLALNYNMVSNATTVITTSPTDPDYYFQAEAADENAGVNFYMPANTVNIQAYRRALVKSKIYQSGQQFAHWSNSSRMGAVLMAYKTFDTSAAGEYIEGSEEEEQ